MDGIICNILILLLREIEPFFWDIFCRKNYIMEDGERKYKRKEYIILFIAILVKNILAIQTEDIRTVNFIINNLFLVIYYVYAVNVYHVSKRMTVCVLAIYDMTVVLLEYVFSFIVICVAKIADFKLMSQPGGILIFTYMFIAIGGAVVLWILAHAERDYAEEMEEDNVFGMLRLMLMIDIGTFFIFSIIPNSSACDIFNIGTFIALICEIVLVVYALKNLIEDVRVKRTYEINLKIANNRIQMLKDVQTRNECAGKLVHDTKNHISTIGLYLKSGMEDVAYQYILGLEPELKSVKMVDKGDIPLSVLLYGKQQEAKEKGVYFEYLVCVQDIKISLVDSSKIIFNMADNAIEYAERTCNKEFGVDFRIYIDEPNLIIECTNVLENEIKFDSGGKIQTTKKNKAEHGKGIQIISDTVIKNDGYVVIQDKTGIFTIKAIFDSDKAILLPDESDEEGYAEI